MAVSNSSCSSSILNPSVCVQATGTVASKLALTVTQNDHGFSAGSAIRWNSGVDGNTAEYVAAQANNAYNAEVIGIVSEVHGSNTFELTLSGTVKMNDYFSNTTGSIPAGITRDDVFFLSGYTAGWLDSKRPSTPGWVAKPVITRLADDPEMNIFGMVTNYVGNLLGGNVAVSLGALIPAGTIQAFLGTTSKIPDGWAWCDGDGYTDANVPGLPVSNFAEYYDNVGLRYGWVEAIKTDWANPTTGDKIEQVVDGRTIGGIIAGVSGGVEADGLRYVFVKQSPENDIPLAKNGNFTVIKDEGVRGEESSEIDKTSVTKDSLYLFNRSLSGTTFVVTTQDGTQFSASSFDDKSGVAGVYSVLVPDLRNKFLMGADSLPIGTEPNKADPHPLNKSGGSSKFSLDYPEANVDGEEGTDLSSGSDSGWASHQNNLPPYITVNWIIRTDPNAYAALIDQLEIKNLKLTNLPTSGSGEEQWTVYRDSTGQLKITT